VCGVILSESIMPFWLAAASGIFSARRSFALEDLPVATLNMSAGRGIPVKAIGCSRFAVKDMALSKQCTRTIAQVVSVINSVNTNLEIHIRIRRILHS
jgi:hypothetical protein